jgi:hypothetical protein
MFPRHRSQQIIGAIMAALFLWGSLHALGAYLYDLDVRKPLVVYAFMLLFLGGWLLALLVRDRKLRRDFQNLPPHDEPDPPPQAAPQRGSRQ